MTQTIGFAMKEGGRTKKTGRKRFNTPLFIMAMLGVAFLMVFNYLPMFGIVVAFKDMDRVLNITKALVEKPFVGLDNFTAFLNDKEFINIMMNTLGMNFLQLIIGFPAPIIFALLLNEVIHTKFKKMVQTITYMPYFISWVVFGGIVIGMLSSDGGLINTILIKLKIIDSAIPFTSKPEYFWGIIIISGIIKGIGWGTVIYLAAITSVDQDQYEAAVIDGANRFQKMWYVTLPNISGTIIVFLLLNISNLLTSNFDQIYILQNSLNYARSEVIDTYVYKLGIAQMRYSYTTAVGLFKSVIAITSLALSNMIAKKYLGRGLY
jgi:putative aldouronate transport system permease protein